MRNTIKNFRTAMENLDKGFTAVADAASQKATRERLSIDAPTRERQKAEASSKVSR